MISSRLTSTGKLLVNGILDEFTGVPVIDSSTVLWLDVAQTNSYAGSGNTWTDLTTPQYNFTLYNTPTYNSSGWFEFNPTSSECAAITHTSALKPDNAITIEQWLNATDWSAGTPTVYITALSCTQGGGYAHYIWTNTFTSYIYANILNNYLKPSADITGFTGWHHFTTTFDGRYARLYVDGVLADTQDAGSNTTIRYDIDNDIVIGAEAGTLSTPQGFYWNGKIATTTIYNRALTPDEISKNYNALAGRFGLVKNPDTSYVQKTTAAAVFASEFDEITINPITSGIARKIYPNGTYQVAEEFDEFTGAPIVDSSLKVWLDAGQTASYPGSGTTWYDLSGNGSNATLYNTVSYDKSSVAMNFNGGYIAIPSGNVTNVVTTSAVTVSVWFNASTIDTSYRRLVSRDSYPNQNWYIEFNGGNVGNVFGYSGTASTGNTPVSANAWYNIVMTATTSTVRLYSNGSLAFNGSASSFTTSTAAIGIGSDANGSTTFLGKISQVMIYNRALTADEVTQNFNALRNRYGI